jgi:hypothetical protein
MTPPPERQACFMELPCFCVESPDHSSAQYHAGRPQPLKINELVNADEFTDNIKKISWLFLCQSSTSPWKR